MKILLISPEFSIKETKGLARYAYEIYKRLKKKCKIDVVFRKKFHKGLFGFVYSLIYSNLSVLIKGKNYDVIHAISPELAFSASLFYRNKLIVTFHDLFPITHWKELKYKVGILTYIFSYLIWKLAAKAKIVVANSSLTKEYLEKIFKRTDTKIILEGIDKKFKQTKQKNKELTLCFVGNYSFRKRVDIVLKIYEKLKRYERVNLIIIGGKLKSIYQTNFNLSHINDPNIKILNKVSDKKLVEVYSISHFLIFPSIVEGFGLPILEAIRCKTLPITFKYSEIPKEIKQLSIECENVEDATKKIISLWRNKEEYKKLVNNFYKKLKIFDWKITCNEYLNLYKKIANYGKG